MSLDEGIECMKKCFKEINTRFLMGGATFTLKVMVLTTTPGRAPRHRPPEGFPHPDRFFKGVRSSQPSWSEARANEREGKTCSRVAPDHVGAEGVLLDGEEVFSGV